MSNTNVPNLALTTEEMSMLRYIATHGNAVTMPELVKDAGKKEVEQKLPMLIYQGFICKEAKPRTPGGYLYSITLKSIKKIRAEKAAARVSDRQVPVKA